ncbi:unnamed protein product [Nippostrongylus brasiliensis]|uniref:Ectonucleotide pyrophosphatase/phosphodiesterase family member 3 n=1 Tax=Nippostrongylus brasiliensis TaxID=27835 RepID=A0A0N4XU65_NIPBR|nr:unnamed protein product [Nippostrongylus brasiliensis]
MGPIWLFPHCLYFSKLYIILIRPVPYFYVLLVTLLTMALIGVILGLVVIVKLGQMQQSEAKRTQNIQDVLNVHSTDRTLDGIALGFQRGYENPNLLSYSKIKECPGQCLRRDFSKPPLVILSLDGFARQYLDRYSVEALSYIKKCGATAERVFPPFPSRTFPSHYTMVTGLYPESHGIVDNNVLDTNISDRLESMKSATLPPGFYRGDPIWNVYKRSGGRTACLFWPGCAYNISGMGPDISPPYNKDLPFRNRFDQVINWLMLPKDRRPGLITAYMDQPDTTGHYQIDDKDIERQLQELDTLLRYFLDRLQSEGLLPCINLAIVSDHGMQKTNYTYYFSDAYKDPNVITASGVVGRVYKYKSGSLAGRKRVFDGDFTHTIPEATVEQLSKPFTCNRGERWRVFDRHSIPTRKHYQKTPRVGDLIVQGEPGTSFVQDPSKDWKLRGDHGYDYLNPSMHTIFFAMGTECPRTGPPAAVGCSSGCSSDELQRITQRLQCDSEPNVPFRISSDKFRRCYQNYCEKTVVVGVGNDAPAVVTEILTKEQHLSNESCPFVNSKYGVVCSPISSSPGFTIGSLSADTRSGLANISTIAVALKDGFVRDFLAPLNNYTRSVVEQMGRAPEKRLLEYTARLKDVELISGIQLQFPQLRYEELLRLRTHIALQLW